ncbi:VanZ family protein [Desulfosporosinus lacus]|uniref:Glycopeptide antibiotics resistance protein n=1 Tax=Desulfosporosinus lacus DSM 15449 TaxID=1121420 RepID=A0A1M5X9F2_9FIRM|nr:VanZ family protein [Desulfosporosinus lacus]SHH96477.1 Glycopeptide antibiotics resistance protein [Desulfosporosinus lacus DSM 15449]
MIITILRFIIVSITWFISTLPFLIPYHILLTSQSKKIGNKLSIEHIVIVYIFVYYLTGVLSFTGIPSIRDIVYNSFGIITPKGLNFPPDEINLIPFYWITEGVRPYIENILLFIPLGFMLPFIWKKYEVLRKTALSGIKFSLIIELSQLFNRRITDIDDLLMNTLGALIGWVIFRLLKEHLSKLQNKVSVQSTNIEKIPLLLREEACFYMAIAFAGMFLVFYPFLRSLIYPFLRSVF